MLGDDLLYILIGITIVLILLYIMPIQIALRLKRKDKYDIVLINVKTLYGLVKMNAEIPYMDFIIKNKKPAIKYGRNINSKIVKKLIGNLEKIFSVNDAKKMYKNYQINKVRFASINKYIKSKIQIKSLFLNVRLGLGNPAETAIAYGIFTAFFGSMIALLSQSIHTEISKIDINPEFESACFQLELSCIIILKLGHIINIGTRLLPFAISKMRKRTTTPNLSVN